MKKSLQEKKMEQIARLLSGNLSYIGGERESGPNGAKAEFLRTSAAFLRKLGKDLGFAEMKVSTNPAGIAVSGSVSLYGMWGDGNGLCFVLEQSAFRQQMLLYREISRLDDYRGKQNQYYMLSDFAKADYAGLCRCFLHFRKEADAYAA